MRWIRPVKPKPKVTLTSLVGAYSSDSDLSDGDADTAAAAPPKAPMLAGTKDKDDAADDNLDPKLADFFNDISQIDEGGAAATKDNPTPSTSNGDGEDDGEDDGDGDSDGDDAGSASDDSLDDIDGLPLIPDAAMALTATLDPHRVAGKRARLAALGTTVADPLRDAGALALEEAEEAEEAVAKLPPPAVAVAASAAATAKGGIAGKFAALQEQLKHIGVSALAVPGLTKWHLALIKLEVHLTWA